MVAMPDPDEHVDLQVTGLKLLLLGLILVLVGIGTNSRMYLFLGLIVGIGGMFVE